MSSPEIAMSAMPVHPLSTACSARYSSAWMPRGGLDAHREVLRDDRDLLTVGSEVHGDGEDPRVVVAEAHAGGQNGGSGVGQLDTQRSPLPDRDGEVQSTVLDTQLVEVAQSLPGEVADLRVVPLLRAP
jgi:hypothetical protein